MNWKHIYRCLKEQKRDIVQDIQPLTGPYPEYVVVKFRLIRTEVSVTMIAGRSSSGESLTCLEPFRQD